jgi:hypothetical protein
MEMTDNQRDFYRIQDRLLMAWRHADIEPTSESESALLSLNRDIESELLELNDEYPEIAKALTLLNRKIDMLTALIIHPETAPVTSEDSAIRPMLT